MTEKTKVSDCHGADVKTDVPDFIAGDEIVKVKYKYICRACEKPCNAIEVNSTNGEEIQENNEEIESEEQIEESVESLSEEAEEAKGRKITCCRCGKFLGEIRDATLRKEMVFACEQCRKNWLTFKNYFDLQKARAKSSSGDFWDFLKDFPKE